MYCLRGLSWDTGLREGEGSCPGSRLLEGKGNEKWLHHVSKSPSSGRVGGTLLEKAELTSSRKDRIWGLNGL